MRRIAKVFLKGGDIQTYDINKNRVRSEGSSLLIEQFLDFAWRPCSDGEAMTCVPFRMYPHGEWLLVKWETEE